MILKKEAKQIKDFDSSTFVTTNQLSKILDKRNAFKEELLNIFKIDEEQTEVLKVGNAKFLIDALNKLDDQCEKIDITAKIKDINLKKILEDEKALFEIFSISNKFVLLKNTSDLLVAETRYSAKNDLLDYYNFSKFANYCRDKILII
jgi:DNA-binding Xre family transcriptional regulator